MHTSPSQSYTHYRILSPWVTTVARFHCCALFTNNYVLLIILWNYRYTWDITCTHDLNFKLCLTCLSSLLIESLDTSVFFFKSVIAFCLAFRTPTLHFSADALANFTKLCRSSLVILKWGVKDRQAHSALATTEPPRGRHVTVSSRKKV